MQNEKIEIKDLDHYKKSNELLQAVVKAGDDLLTADPNSAAYLALQSLYELAKAELMRFENGK